MSRVIIIHLFGLLLLGTACTSEKEHSEDEPEKIDYKVHSILPHDTASFTEGLLVHDGKLYESTGEYGKSWLGRINIKTGRPEKKVQLDEEFFGEGITILNNKIYQLTYKSGKGFVYDLHSLEKIDEFSYEGEGWGLTHDGRQLIMSNGSSRLYYLDTASLKITKTLEVTFQAKPLKQLNELEYVNGFIFANVWQTNTIVKIDQESGKVTGALNLAQLAQRAQQLNPQVDVLNGIAWYEPTKSLLVTGKYWPEIYALKLE